VGYKDANFGGVGFACPQFVLYVVRMIRRDTPVKQKRRRMRLTYPEALRPQIVGSNYSVIDLSEAGLLFRCPGESAEALRLAQLGMPFRERIQFADGEQLQLIGFIARCHSCVHTRWTLFTCRLLEPLPRERISKEMSQVMQQYPYFMAG